MSRIVPETAGNGAPTVITEDITEGVVGTAVVGVYTNVNPVVKNINGFDILNFSLEPGASILTNQETMTYMDGGLVTSATLGSGGVWSWIARDVTGSSVLQNLVTNPTPEVRKITLSPLLQGSIVQVNVRRGERWRFADHSFLACTPNLVISGNLNVFSNFRLMFVGQGVTYTTVEATDGDGIVWVSAYGAAVKHDMTLGVADSVPLFINNGCFLGMLDYKDGIDYWHDYVDVGTANDLFSALFTQLGWVMKIQDKEPRVREGPITCSVITQSLNPHNFERYVSNIAAKVASAPSSSSILFAGYGADYKYSVAPVVPITAAVVATAIVTGPGPATAPNRQNPESNIAATGPVGPTATAPNNNQQQPPPNNNQQQQPAPNNNYEEQQQPANNGANQSGGGSRRRRTKNRGTIRRR